MSHEKEKKGSIPELLKGSELSRSEPTEGSSSISEKSESEIFKTLRNLQKQFTQEKAARISIEEFVTAPSSKPFVLAVMKQFYSKLDHLTDPKIKRRQAYILNKLACLRETKYEGTLVVDSKEIQEALFSLPPSEKAAFTRLIFLPPLPADQSEQLTAFTNLKTASSQERKQAAAPGKPRSFIDTSLNAFRGIGIGPKCDGKAPNDLQALRDVWKKRILEMAVQFPIDEFVKAPSTNPCVSAVMAQYRHEHPTSFDLPLPIQRRQAYALHKMAALLGTEEEGEFELSVDPGTLEYDDELPVFEIRAVTERLLYALKLLPETERNLFTGFILSVTPSEQQLEELAHFPKLRRLIFVDFVVPELLPLLSKLQTLRELSFDMTTFPMRALTVNTKKMDGQARIGDDCIIEDILMKVALPRLLKLHFEFEQSCGQKGGNLPVIKHIVANSPRLIELSLLNWGESVSDDCMREIAKLTQLRVLNLGGCADFSDKGLSFLQHLPLQKLLLGPQVKITKKGLKSLPKTLEYIDLHECEEIKTVDDLMPLTRLPHLRFIDLTFVHDKSRSQISLAKFLDKFLDQLPSTCQVKINEDTILKGRKTPEKEHKDGAPFAERIEVGAKAAGKRR